MIDATMADEYVGPTGAARILERSAQRVRQLANMGVLPPAVIGPGGWRLFRRVDVERLAQVRGADAERRVMVGR